MCSWIDSSLLFHVLSNCHERIFSYDLNHVSVWGIIELSALFIIGKVLRLHVLWAKFPGSVVMQFPVIVKLVSVPSPHHHYCVSSLVLLENQWKLHKTETDSLRNSICCLLKKLTAVLDCLEAQISRLLTAGTHQEWLTQGRAHLIMEDPHKGTALLKNANYMHLHDMEAHFRYHYHQAE